MGFIYICWLQRNIEIEEIWMLFQFWSGEYSVGYWPFCPLPLSYSFCFPFCWYLSCFYHPQLYNSPSLFNFSAFVYPILSLSPSSFESEHFFLLYAVSMLTGEAFGVQARQSPCSQFWCPVPQWPSASERDSCRKSSVCFFGVDYAQFGWHWIMKVDHAQGVQNVQRISLPASNKPLLSMCKWQFSEAFNSARFAWIFTRTAKSASVPPKLPFCSKCGGARIFQQTAVRIYLGQNSILPDPHSCKWLNHFYWNLIVIIIISLRQPLCMENFILNS